MVEVAEGCAPIALIAGGTGGHVLPALALGGELTRRGYPVHLVTDVRGRRYVDSESFLTVSIVPSGTLSLQRPLTLITGPVRIFGGILSALRLFLRVRPAAVVCFGGYPSVPPAVAAWLLRIPICLHEQNAIMGRANRFLARFARAIALSFPDTRGIEAVSVELVCTGNPVRASIVAGSHSPYTPPVADGTFNLLIFGGSHGASIFSDVVPAAIALLSTDQKRRLRIAQQARDADVWRVGAKYRSMEVDATVSSFFSDMPSRLIESHLVIARSGATTVAELVVLGRPSILVPLPVTLEGDQLANADFLEKLGASFVIRQTDFTPEYLAGKLDSFLTQGGDLLAHTARAASAIRCTDAEKRLADLVLGLVGDQSTEGLPA